METVVLNEEFARAGAPLRADFFGDTLVGPTILQWGTEEQKKDFLPKILSGEIAWCQGFSEPDAGSDLAGLKTKAELDGDEWVINGQKIWTTQAQYADYIFVLAAPTRRRRSTRASPTCSCPMKQAGIEVRPIEQIDGSAEFNEVFFTERPLPEGERRRRGQQRLERGHDHARLRAGHVGHHRLPPLREGARGDHRRGQGQRQDRRPGRAPGPADAWSKVQIMRINGFRTLTAVVQGKKDMGVAALGATNKMFWSEYHRDAMNLAMDILGLDGQILTGRSRRRGVRAGLRPPRTASAEYPASVLQSAFFFSPVRDDLGRHGPDPAQHRRRAGAGPAQGTQAGLTRSWASQRTQAGLRRAAPGGATRHPQSAGAIDVVPITFALVDDADRHRCRPQAEAHDRGCNGSTTSGPIPR